MKLQEAFNILGIPAGNITNEEIKQAYRKAAQKYHPDRNPAGLEMMQAINAAYEVIKDFSGEVYAKGNNTNYGDQINAALNAIIGLGLDIEVCGSWVWVTGDTKPHKEILKQAGFFWAVKKLAWYFRPEEYKCYRSKGSLSLDEIRQKYGSQTVNDGYVKKTGFKIGSTQAV